MRWEYHQQGLLCPHAQTTYPFSRRRGLSCVSCPHLHQTPGMFLLSYAAPWLLALDKTTEHLIAAWDAGRSCQGKSELVAGNALLRKPLIILRRQSKRPVGAKRDRSLLVLLARATRFWRQALLIVQEDDPFAMAPSELSSFLEAPVESHFEYTKGNGRDHCIDQRHGKEQSALGG